MAAVTLTGRMPATSTSPWRVRRSRQARSPGRGLSPSSQIRAQRQRLRGVGVTDTQLREGAALLAAVQAQLSSGGYSGVAQARRNGVQAHHRQRGDAPWTDNRHQPDRQTDDLRQTDTAQSMGAQTIGSRQAGSKRAGGVQTAGGQRASQLGTNTGKARSRKPTRTESVDTGIIRAESWPFFEAPTSSDAVDPSVSLQEDARTVPTVGADGWPTGFGVGPSHSESTINSGTRRRPTSVSGMRPSSFGGSNFGRPSTSEGAGATRRPARASTSEGASRPSARPSTSEGCRTFGRPPEGSRMRGSSAGRPVTVDGTRPHGRTSADGWSGHGDGASWFRAEQETARREQAAAKEAEERWRAHFDDQSPDPRQDSWERRQARRRATEERSERRASQFRAQKAREKAVTRQQSAMDDIWSEAESDLQARARKRADAAAKAAREKADAEQAAREVATSDLAPRGRPERADARPPAEEEDSLGVDGSDGTRVETDHTTYDDEELLDAWDAVCGGQRGRDTELDVDQVGELLMQLGKPVGCYELQYIVSKIGDPVTGRICLTAFRKWWDDVLREFAEWCATQSAGPSSAAAQPVQGENCDSDGARKWQTHSSMRSSSSNETAAGGRGVSGSNDTGHNCDDGLQSHDQRTPDAGTMDAVARLSPEELAASAEQEVEAARAAAVAQSHAEAEQLRWKRHISEKQRTRVLAHRGQQKALEEEAAAKRELVSHITDRLARQVRGKSFVAVLQEFGLQVAQGEESHGAAVHKLYRRALSVYHPDRATRRGLSWQKVTEAEETYKMLQIQYERYVAQRQSKQQQGQRRRQ